MQTVTFIEGTGSGGEEESCPRTSSGISTVFGVKGVPRGAHSWPESESRDG